MLPVLKSPVEPLEDPLPLVRRLRPVVLILAALVPGDTTVTVTCLLTAELAPLVAAAGTTKGKSVTSWWLIGDDDEANAELEGC